MPEIAAARCFSCDQLVFYLHVFFVFFVFLNYFLQLTL